MRRALGVGMGITLMVTTLGGCGGPEVVQGFCRRSPSVPAPNDGVLYVKREDGSTYRLFDVDGAHIPCKVRDVYLPPEFFEVP